MIIVGGQGFNQSPRQRHGVAPSPDAMIVSGPALRGQGPRPRLQHRVICERQRSAALTAGPPLHSSRSKNAYRTATRGLRVEREVDPFGGVQLRVELKLSARPIALMKA